MKPRFTLIEALVVISIIAVIAALLIAVIMAARETTANRANNSMPTVEVIDGPQSSRITVLETTYYRTKYGSDMYFTVFRDGKTEKEWIAIKTNDGVTVTPTQ